MRKRVYWHLCAKLELSLEKILCVSLGRVKL